MAPETGPAWGSEIQEYFGAFAAAANAHDLNQTMAFFADDATLVASSGYAVSGVRRIDASIQAAMADGSRRPVMVLAALHPDEPALGPGPDFVFDPGDALLLSDIEYGQATGCPPEREPCHIRELAIVDVEDGLVGTYATLVMAADLRALVGEDDAETLAALDGIESFYREYAALWSDGSVEDIRNVYDRFAEVEHGMWGADLRGKDGVTDLVASLRQQHGRIRVDPVSMADIGVDDSGAAVFFAGSPLEPYMLAGLYRVALGDDDPVVAGIVWRRGPTGIGLEWSAVEVGASQVGEIVDRIDPWWTALAAPVVEPPDCRTLEDVLPQGSLEVCNGTAELDELVAWAVGRFEQAGLEMPRPDRVSFPPSDRCRRAASGLAVDTGDGVQVQLCFGPEALAAGAAANARFTLLHELGHVWTAQFLPEEGRQEFLLDRGVEAWRDPEGTWADQGSEHAAEILAWALMDEPVDVVRLPDAGCDRLAEGFRILTGREPLVTQEECEGS